MKTRGIDGFFLFHMYILTEVITQTQALDGQTAVLLGCSSFM